MQNHTKVFLDHWNYHGIIPCMVCGKEAVDIHHIIHRSRGWKNSVDNLIALCREDHQKAHRIGGNLTKESLQSILNVCIKSRS